MRQDKALARCEETKDTTPKPRMPIRVAADAEGKITIQSTPEVALRSLFGEGGDLYAANLLYHEIGGLVGNSADRINEILAMVDGLKPQGAAEAILAVQIVAVHNLSLRLHGIAADAVDTRRLIDLTRCALTASRTTGELLGRLADGRRPAASTQKIIVERVDGGQVAIGCTSEPGGEGAA